MNVLLINPPAQGVYDTIDIKLPPLGLAYIAAVLRENGHNIKIVDLNVDDDLWGVVKERKWDVVGLSGDTSRYPISMEIAKQIKKNFGYTIFTGGPHVTFFEKETLNTGFVDFIIRGEGEYITLHLLDALQHHTPLENVRGITFKRNGKFIKTLQAPVIEDLNSLPYPARDLLPMEKYKVTLFYGRPITSILTSRGCPFNCYFCSSSQFSNLIWRRRSPKNIVDEIQYVIKKYDYHAFAFVDDNFTLNPKRVIEIAKEVVKRKLDIIWWAFSRVDELLGHEDMINWMAKSGCRMVFLGIESVSKEVLDEYNKGITANDSLKAVRLLKKYSIDTWGSFIIGAFDETREMIKNTVRFAKMLDPKNVQFSILTPFPGTRLYEDAERMGIIQHKNWRYYDGAHAVMRTKYLKPEEIQRLLNEAYISFYIRPHRLIRILPTIIRYLKELKGKRLREKRIEEMILRGPNYEKNVVQRPHYIHNFNK